MVNNKIVYQFFLGLSPDSRGRLIGDILEFDESEIENNHDFIQWIFPTKEASQYNYSAPQISEMFKDLFLNNEIAQENFCESCRMFLNFIGFDCCNKKDNIITNIKNKKKYYDLPTHNLLRITRVLNSLNQIGKKSCSKKLFIQLEKIRNENPKKVPKDSFEFWKRTQCTCSH